MKKVVVAILSIAVTLIVIGVVLSLTACCPTPEVTQPGATPPPVTQGELGIGDTGQSNILRVTLDDVYFAQIFWLGVGETKETLVLKLIVQNIGESGYRHFPYIIGSRGKVYHFLEKERYSYYLVSGEVRTCVWYSSPDYGIPPKDATNLRLIVVPQRSEGLERVEIFEEKVEFELPQLSTLPVR